MKITIVGVGNLGGALAKRFLESGISRDDITLVSRDSSKTQIIAHSLELPVRSSLQCSQDEIVIIAVKPQDARSLEPVLVGNVPKTALILSVMAGISCSSLESMYDHTFVARAMPNLGVVVGESATSYFLPPELEEYRMKLESLLRMGGPLFRVSDEQMLEVSTAVAGSGPAYICWLAEQLQASAEQHGFDSKEARKLVLQTLKSTLSYLENSGENFVSLRQKVTSPNGTTARAFSVLEDSNTTTVLAKAIDAARVRAAELAKTRSG